MQPCLVHHCIFHTGIYCICKVIVLDISFQEKYAKNLKYIKCHLTVKQVNLVKLFCLLTSYCTELNYQENQLHSNQYNQICITIHTLNKKYSHWIFSLFFKKSWRGIVSCMWKLSFPINLLWTNKQKMMKTKSKFLLMPLPHIFSCVHKQLKHANAVWRKFDISIIDEK